MSGSQCGTVPVFGVPFRPWTMQRTLSWVRDQIGVARQGHVGPTYLVTANVNYCMLTARTPQLRRINREAAGVVADGMPIVAWSKLWPGAEPLPERVAGSELIGEVCRQAAECGHRVYFLGGEPDVLRATCATLKAKHPKLQIVGAHSPPFRELKPSENNALVRRIRGAKPDILLVAFGQPKGELWIAKHREALGVPISMQLGASFDFVAGKVRRAPRWVQKGGLEWAFRLLMEPRRLTGRYAANAWFLGMSLLRDLAGRPATA